MQAVLRAVPTKDSIGRTLRDLFAFSYSGKVFRSAGQVDGVSMPDGLPGHINLRQNYPNPFNPSIRMTYSLRKAPEVTLKIYDVLGREIAVLENERKQAGEHTVVWSTEGMPSGVYFCRLVAGDFQQTKRMVLMK